jgi:hypothetical protein
MMTPTCSAALALLDDEASLVDEYFLGLDEDGLDIAYSIDIYHHMVDSRTTSPY